MDQEHVPAMQRVPPELWRKIFVTLHDINIAHEKEPLLPERDLQSICGVCKQWRSIAIMTSYLWRIVTFLLGPNKKRSINSLEYFRVALVRSGQQPLRVTVCLTDRCSTKFATISAHVMPHMHRLEHLILWYYGHGTPAKRRIFNGNPMTLLDKTIPWSGIPSSKLQSLDLSYLTFATLEEFRLILNNCRELQELGIVNVEFEQFGALIPEDGVFPLCLPSLEVAELDFDLLLELQLYSLSMPRLIRLTIFCATPDGWIQRRSTEFSAPDTLQYFGVTGPFSDDFVISTLFPEDSHGDPTSRFPSLRKLCLYGCQAGSDLMSYVSDTAMDILLLSKLKHMEIFWGSCSDEDILEIMDAYTSSIDESNEWDDPNEASRPHVDDGALTSPNAEAMPGHDDVTDEIPSKVTIFLDIQGCPQTTETLGEVIRERGCGIWRKEFSSKRDFKFKPYLTHFPRV